MKFGFDYKYDSTSGWGQSGCKAEGGIGPPPLHSGVDSPACWYY